VYQKLKITLYEAWYLLLSQVKVDATATFITMTNTNKMLPVLLVEELL